MEEKVVKDFIFFFFFMGHLKKGGGISYIPGYCPDFN